MSQPRSGHSSYSAATAQDELNPAMALRLLATGHYIAQVVYVAAQLRLADLLANGPRSAEDLAREAGVHAPSLYRLQRVLAAHGVLDEVAPGQFALTPVGAYLRSDDPGSMRDAVLMWGSEHFWQSVGDLLHCIQTGDNAVQHLLGVATPFEYYQTHPELGAMMNAGWAALAHGYPEEVAAAYDFSQINTLVDVGGNRGQVLAPILQAYPALHAILYDLPNVVAAAAPFLEAAGVADRCTLVGGDMFVEIPEGGDVYMLSRVIHDWDDAKAASILLAARKAMRPDTTVLIIERVLPALLDQSPNVQVTLQSDLNMLLRLGGRERTDAEYEALLGITGFVVERVVTTPSGYSVVQARPATPGH